MAYILDALVLVIIGVFALLSAKRGFVRTIIEIVGFVLVILFANNVSPAISNLTYDKLIEPSIVKSLDNIDLENNISSIEVKLPDFVSKILGDNLNLESFVNTIESNINNGAQNAVVTASQSVIKPAVTTILNLLYTLIITVVLLFVVNLLAKFINRLFSFSLVGKANKILGAVLGMIKGVAVAVIFCTVISLIVPITAEGFLIFTTANIQNSLIFKLLCFSL